MIRRVVHYTDTSGYGGAEKMLLTLLARLDRSRWDSVLMHHRNEAAMELGELARGMGLRTRVLSFGAATGRGAEVRRIGSVLREERPAIFHAHLVWSRRCTGGLIGARAAFVPRVVATQQLYGPPDSRRESLRQWLVSLAPHRYLAVSGAMAEQLRRVVARPSRVSIVRNAIEPEAFLEARGDLRPFLQGESNLPLVLTLARLELQKGIDHLLTAAERVTEARFVVAGEGSERERLEARAHERGIADRVRFLGLRHDVPELLAACDIFVLPSMFEGLPVSVLEAMAAAKPVVATRIPGTDEALIDGETGILVPPGDPDALATAVARLLADPPLRRAMGSAGRSRVATHFSAEGMTRKVEAIYAELLRSTPEAENPGVEPSLFALPSNPREP